MSCKHIPLPTYEHILHANPFQTRPHHFPKWISTDGLFACLDLLLAGKKNCYGQRKHHLRQLPGGKTRRRKNAPGWILSYISISWPWNGHKMKWSIWKLSQMLMWFPIWPPWGFSCLYLKKPPTSHPRFGFSPVNVGFLDLFQET